MYGLAKKVQLQVNCIANCCGVPLSLFKSFSDRKKNSILIRRTSAILPIREFCVNELNCNNVSYTLEQIKKRSLRFCNCIDFKVLLNCPCGHLVLLDSNYPQYWVLLDTCLTWTPCLLRYLVVQDTVSPCTMDLFGHQVPLYAGFPGHWDPG